MTGLVSLRSPPDHTALTLLHRLFLGDFPPKPGRDLVTVRMAMTIIVVTCKQPYIWAALG